MNERLPVAVCALDPISQAGIVGQLRGRPEIRIVEDLQAEPAAVAIVVIDRVDEQAVQAIRSAVRRGCARVLVIATQVTSDDVLAATEAGCSGLLRRGEAQPERLVRAIRAAAAGDGTLPPDLLGRLLDQVGQIQREALTPRGIPFGRLTKRELQVLRLAADGLATNEIAHQIGYAERTVKNIIHDVTTRLNLRNRAHAVAYAVREGLI